MEAEQSSSVPQPKSLIDQSVVPGDVVLDLSNMANKTIKLGLGLRQDGDTITAMKAGILRYKKPNKYWVESSTKRYVPSVGDSVLGIVVDTKADNFIVDIKGPTLAFLPVLAFEGASRKNKPKFERVECNGKSAEFGPLKDGYMFETSTGLSRMLLSSPTCPVLDALGKKQSFETAVGLNGRVWVNASSPETVVLVSNSILKSEFLSGTQQRTMVDKLMKKIKQ